MNIAHSQTDSPPPPVGGNGITVHCAKQLEIKGFSSTKSWKVVVGLPFYVNGLDPALAQPPYTWQLGDFPSGTFRWEFTSPTGLFGMTTLKNNGLPTNNADFGDAHGVVKLTSVSESTLSTDPYLNKKVKVFFKKDDMNPNTFFPNQEPNWFYYWNKLIPKFTIIKLTYDNNMPKDIYAFTNPFTREVHVSQKSSEFNDETGHQGLHAFYETVAHENHHLVLWDLRWPNGYIPLEDGDKDFYPDYWEDHDPVAIENDFHSNDHNDIYTNPGSSGEKYEEKACRAVEHNLDESVYDSFDWSYDILNLNQGKQWK